MAIITMTMLQKFNPQELISFGSSGGISNVRVVDAMKKAHVNVVAFENQAFLQTCWVYGKSCVAVRAVSNRLPVDTSNSSTAASLAGEYASKVSVMLLAASQKHVRPLHQ